MKKLILFALILFPASLLAQNNFGSVKLGLFSPGATSAGFIIGYEGGTNIDEVISWGYSVDWFNKNYTDQNLVNEFNDFYGPSYSLNELRAKTNLHAIPIMASLTGSWPIAYRTRAFVTGSAGVEVLLIYYRNYENPDNDEFKAAFDFAWRIGGGVIYEIGRRSDGFIELTYHNAKPSWQFEVKDQQTNKTRVFERKFDMSGMMIRAGVRFYF